MPELPEVEVSRLGITPWLQGQTITNIIVRDVRLRWPVPDTLQQACGRTIQHIRRRAKYLLINVGIGDIVLHLGMSGKLRVIDAQHPPVKHDHVDIVLSNGKCLRYNDPRRFGACLWQPNDVLLPLLSKLGPEPLTSDFTPQRLITLAKGKKSPVKTFIMDNDVVVGVGNIYANEALFMAGIDPRRAAGRVSAKRYQMLTQTIKTVLEKAIAQGGTTLKDFAQSDGSPGYFAQHLRVYGRSGEPCEVCDTEIKSVVIGQRNTFFCPECQR
ncbi:bifunctional DNA-formamidopyrimidine glycosylase/DNA-(apurinic or apyrimidinic site) lyase [Aestuariibacter sp. A3R04]|uniref:bifunctional DNA-formamidopyrimidine glycosylase/DNA-(apurinic or apyrimidinic site) lyase n=1 Tax=Aestuariibacter sp. A3R04 TaxID=2841571 RepID=UPI001C096FB7|nr:bifunctional DNA-formamidopyrimidine glycosylase/DNA-(apurinic or apyrimidinic site) lyase [Aestuariibacter sp. A3R04]MBU3023854.1 bifunctional DNA-formamidopyrimidine glycosylase/DNA-(apurinic or apyrimidinic site) lyase [Aestuariibacter sp. A3R04]